MKWQLICFSCSVNQFITKRKHKHTHTQCKVFHFDTPDLGGLCEVFTRNWQTSWGTNSCTRVPHASGDFPCQTWSAHTRAHTHTYTLLTINLRTDNNLKTSNNQLQLLQQPTTAAAAAVAAAAAQKAYAMLAHWWRLHTDTTEPTGNNCQTGCHSHTRVPTRTHTLLTFEHTLNTHSDWALKVMLPALPAATHGAH